MSQQRGGRRGDNFVLRLTPEERLELEGMRDETAGPRALGPWLVWAARRAFMPEPILPRHGNATSMGNAASSGKRGSSGHCQSSGIAPPGAAVAAAAAMPAQRRVILDLCAGTGAWSDPYRLSGYDVRRVTLPDGDVHSMRVPPERVHGILCAPPCTEFSLAKNGQRRDIRAGLETVSACLRLVVACRPVWWALENPVGFLSHYLGPSRDVWEPYEFGDPHTKATAIWGEFRIPERGPFVEPVESAMARPTAEERAITPSGFARAFFEANP